MRRRLFWTIAGVAAVTGLLVLVASVVAAQRAAVDATYREMQKSTEEAASLIEDTIEIAQRRPGATGELFRLLEGDLGSQLGRIRRTAGGSEIAFAMISPDGDVESNNDLYQRVDLDEESLSEDDSQFTRSSNGELVVVTPVTVEVRGLEQILLVGIAREAPVLEIADQFSGMILIVLGIGVLAALLARLLSNQVASRLEPLAEASRGLADGDLSVRVPDLGDPELDGVASAFNEMAAELESSRIREREFIIGVGHDLRTPLTTIGGYAEALESGAVAEAEIGRIGAVLGVQSRQLSRLIEDLSMLARLEQPEFGLRIEEVDVGAHVSEIAESFRMQADEAGVGLEIGAASGLVLETDPDRLGQVVQNLVENALRFTPETGSVTVTVSEHGGGGVIEVADSGVGIADEDLPRIFDRHYVVRHRPVRSSGSGLGLSIVKGLVELMGGRVEAKSAEGKGTRISVYLPG
jgi:signal transduction histidine kinase